jgi:hypothetical protein
MQIQTRRDNVAVTGMQNQRAFTVKAGAHIMAVLSGLYKDPVDAMVREYLTNMFDAYVALKRVNPSAQTITPVLHVPSKLDSTLSFTDYGIGMTLEQVWNVYATYGETTKGNNNDEVGGFGLGSKTAFCYNGGANWMIESRRDGVKNVFAAFIGEDGVPNLSHVSSEPTAEHSGMTISIPIRREDSGLVTEAVGKYAPYFPMPLKVTGIDYTPKAPAYFIRGTTYGISASSGYGTNTTRVIMGNVPYMVDTQYLSIPNGEKETRFIRANRIDLFVNIGAVDIVPSRDSLKYTPRTVDTLQKALNAMITDLPSEVGKMVQKCSTEWEAVEQLQTLDTIQARSIVPVMHWNGKEISSRYVTRTPPGLQKLDPTAEVWQYAVTDSHSSKIESSNPVELKVTPDATHPTWVIIDDMAKGGALTARAVVYARCVNRHGARAAKYGHTPGHAYLIKSRLTKANLSAFFGGMPVDKIFTVSELKGTVAVPTSLKVTKDTIYRWSGSSWQARVNVPNGTDTYYYLPLVKDGARYSYETTRWSQKDTLERMVSIAQGLKIDANILYGMKQDDTPNLPANWINLDKAVRDALNTLAQSAVSTVALARMNLPEGISHLVDLLTEAGVTTADPMFVQLVADMQKHKNARQSDAYNTLTNAERYVSAFTPAYNKQLLAVVVPDFETQVTAIFQKYPMLKVVHNVTNGARYGYGIRQDKVFTTHKKALLDYFKSI